MSKHSAHILTAPNFGIDLANPVQGLIATVRAWQQRYALRRHLLEIDDRLLEDMGISRLQARHEAAKPFWRA